MQSEYQNTYEAARIFEAMRGYPTEGAGPFYFRQETARYCRATDGFLGNYVNKEFRFATREEAEAKRNEMIDAEIKEAGIMDCQGECLWTLTKVHPLPPPPPPPMPLPFDEEDCPF